MKTARLLAAALAASWVAASSGSAGAVPATMLLRHYGKNYRAACDAPKPTDTAICFALVRTDVRVAAVHPTATAPPGYGPAQLQAAYGLPSSTGGNGQTVALVEVGDYPTAAADLSTYRSQYGLPACTTANGCLRKVGQAGTSSLPAEDASWAEETALDEDLVSAICPNCHILIVEANSATTSDLEAAENTAANLGASEISNSYGGSEYAATDPAYSHAGVVITASAGDGGYSEGSMQPCSFASVVCTGGTSLQPAAGSRGYAETVWNDLSSQGGAAGSGCSSEVAKPSWQNDKGCTMRSQSDVSFDADPEYGVAVYDSTAYEGYSGWLEFGGTSVASPAISGIYALAGNAGSLGSSAASLLWTNKGSGLYGVTSGNNLAPGGSCSASYPYICTAGTNDDGVYSGPGGWGTPNGVTDF
jgi:subtilase family serine protease